MITDVVAGGCSYVWGDELDNRENRFVNLIAQKFNAELHDTSIRGNANQIIYTDVIDKVLDLIHNKKINQQNILVIINWSFIDRLTYYESSTDKIHCLFEYKFHDNFYCHPLFHDLDVNNNHILNQKKLEHYKLWYYNHYHINYLKYNALFLIYGMINFLKFNNIKYVFGFADLKVIRGLLNEKKDYVDNSKFFRRTSVENVIRAIDQTYFHKELNIANYHRLGFNVGPFFHPKDEAHIEFSEKLYEFIKESYPDV